MTSTVRSRRRASLRVRLGDAAQDKAVLLRGEGDGFAAFYDPERASLDLAVMLSRALLASEGIAIADVVLEGHAPDLTILYRAASKLRLDVEITTGPLITEPVVKTRILDATAGTYFIPEGWDLTDALNRLPGNFAAAHPDIARSLDLIEQEKREGGGGSDEVLDLMTAMILETRDPTGVFNQVRCLLEESQTRVDESAKAGAVF